MYFILSIILYIILRIIICIILCIILHIILCVILSIILRILLCIILHIILCVILSIILCFECYIILYTLHYRSKRRVTRVVVAIEFPVATWSIAKTWVRTLYRHHYCKRVAHLINTLYSMKL